MTHSLPPTPLLHTIAPTTTHTTTTNAAHHRHCLPHPFPQLAKTHPLNRKHNLHHSLRLRLPPAHPRSLSAPNPHPRTHRHNLRLWRSTRVPAGPTAPTHTSPPEQVAASLAPRRSGSSSSSSTAGAAAGERRRPAAKTSQRFYWRHLGRELDVSQQQQRRDVEEDLRGAWGMFRCSAGGGYSGAQRGARTCWA